MGQIQQELRGLLQTFIGAGTALAGGKLGKKMGKKDEKKPEVSSDDKPEQLDTYQTNNSNQQFITAQPKMDNPYRAVADQVNEASQIKATAKARQKENLQERLNKFSKKTGKTIANKYSLKESEEKENK